MIDDFAEILKAGEKPTIKDIAKKWSLSVYTVYQHLDDVIKQTNGLYVDRKELLMRPIDVRMPNSTQLAKTEPLDITGFLESSKNAIAEMQQAAAAVTKVVEIKTSEVEETTLLGEETE
jgi:hypothetical protein